MNDAAGAWPTVELDPLRRLQVIASAAQRPAYAERHFDASAEEVWAVVSDLEHELPHIVSGLRSFVIDDSRGERLSAHAVSSLGHRERFDLVLRPGWCLMQSRILVSGMAAVPEPSGCTFGFFTSLRVPGGRVLHWIRHIAPANRADALLDRLQQRIDLRSFPGAAE